MTSKSTDSNNQYRKVSSIAVQLGLSSNHVRNLIKEGKLQPAFRFGSAFRVPQAAVDLFVKRAVVEPMAQAA